MSYFFTSAAPASGHVSLQEAARLTRLTPSFLRQAILAGRIAANRIASGWVIRRDDLDAFISVR